jgi:hypothetical protein
MKRARKGPYGGQRGEVDLHDGHTASAGRLDDLASCCLAAHFAAATQDHLRAHPRDLPRGFLAHTAVRAGDQRNAAGEVNFGRTVCHRILPR